MTGSEYEPFFAGDADETLTGGPSDLEGVQGRFQAAVAPYLRSPVPWLVWSLVLPAAAKLHHLVLARGGLRGAVLLWSIAILAGGLVEGATLVKTRRKRPSPLVAWVLRMQGNLSLAAVALSLLLLWWGRPEALPGVWLLLVGHSFYVLGGLAFGPFRLYGLALQVGGLLALWPGWDPLDIFAGTLGAANFWMAYKVWRGRG